MICMVLAAGYATRLYPLTENFPKALLEVGGKTILDWLLDDIDRMGVITRYAVISNHKFIGHFRDWADRKRLSAPIAVLDDGSVSNETRLGAVRDIQFALDSLQIDEDVLAIAGDNVLDFSFDKFIAFAREKRASCLMRYRETDVKKLRKCGVMEIGAEDRVLRMAEKPAEPFSEWCAPPFYVYRREDLPLVRRAVESGVNADAPGSLMAWMASQTDVRAMEMPGKRYDIGDTESYQSVCGMYRGIADEKSPTDFKSVTEV